MLAAATATKILIVEDDLDASSALAEFLRRQGYEVAVASTLGEALVKLERGLLPEVAILDLRLPDATGALFLRRVHREKLPIKVAVATAYADAAAHPYLQRFPPDRVFTKPLDFDELAAWLEKLGRQAGS